MKNFNMAVSIVNKIMKGNSFSKAELSAFPFIKNMKKIQPAGLESFSEEVKNFTIFNNGEIISKNDKPTSDVGVIAANATLFANTFIYTASILDGDVSSPEETEVIEPEVVEDDKPRGERTVINPPSFYYRKEFEINISTFAEVFNGKKIDGFKTVNINGDKRRILIDEKTKSIDLVNDSGESSMLISLFSDITEKYLLDLYPEYEYKKIKIIKE